MNTNMEPDHLLRSTSTTQTEIQQVTQGPITAQWIQPSAQRRHPDKFYLIPVDSSGGIETDHLIQVGIEVRQTTTEFLTKEEENMHIQKYS